MPDTVQTLIDEVVSTVDVTPAQALTALNRRHRRMVARARSVRSRVEVGPTVAGQGFYPVSGVVEALAIAVGGVPYGMARRPDIYGYSQGTLVWEGTAGLVVVDSSTSAVDGLTLVPAPQTGGLSIELYAALFPTDLVSSDTASAIKVDEDFYDDLVEAAAATYLRRIGEGDPETAEARFEVRCEEMRSRVARRFRASGPAQIRVQGLNA